MFKVETPGVAAEFGVTLAALNCVAPGLNCGYWLRTASTPMLLF